MESHVKVLGIIHIVFGLMGICVALMFFVIFGLGALGVAGVAAQEEPEALLALPVIAVIGTFLLVLIAVLSLPGIAAGYGLLNYKPWARILAIVLSALNLMSVPVGTAIGVYGLWVLLNKETELLFLDPATRPASPPVP
jgi:hypothetical protein